MKRMILICLMILCLVPLHTVAEQHPASTPLFPAEGENGLWGYADPEGTFIIAPQFDYAFGFRGNYAEVVVFPEDYSGDRNPWASDCSGLIDRDGQFVLEPVYSIDAGYDQMFYGGRDTGIWIVTAGKDDSANPLMGWFDIPSGFFSGLLWDGVWGWISDSRLIPVTDETFRSGYADRATGELVIPCRYNALDPSCFDGGVASVCPEEDSDGAKNKECSRWFLIDEKGAEIPLPEGIFAVPYEGAHDGRIMVADHENAQPYEDGNLYGYADAQGSLVMEPQFIQAQHFYEGLAAVQFREGDWGLIDTAGTVRERGWTDEPDRVWYGNELGYNP